MKPFLLSFVSSFCLHQVNSYLLIKITHPRKLPLIPSLPTLRQGGLNAPSFALQVAWAHSVIIVHIICLCACPHLMVSSRRLEVSLCALNAQHLTLYLEHNGTQ